MYYHVRVDYFDKNIKANQTLFEYDIVEKDEVISDVLLPYLQGKTLVFGGARLATELVGKIQVYESEQDIAQCVKLVNSENNQSGVVMLPCGKEDALLYEDLAKDITRSILKEAQHMIKQE